MYNLKIGFVMVSKTPNEEERKKLQKIVKFNNLIPIYTTSFLCLIFIINFFLKKNPILWSILAIAIIITMILLLLISVLKKCPRCSSWGTPVTGGNCPKCGLHLDPSDNGDKKHTTIQ